MLGAHAKIVAPPELFLLRYEDVGSWRQGRPEAFASLAWLLERVGDGVQAAAIYERFRGQRVLDIYRWLLERVGAERILVDKTPAYGRDPATLTRAEEFEPMYVWLVRHPLGVANSWIDRRRARRWRRAGSLGAAAARRLSRATGPLARWLNARMDARAVETALVRWCTVNEAVADFLARIPETRVCRVAYEDLVQYPERVLTTLCARLRIGFEPAMLEPWKHLPDALAWGIGDDLIRSHDAIRATRANSWRDVLDETHLDTRTRALMQRLGLPWAADSHATSPRPLTGASEMSHDRPPRSGREPPRDQAARSEH